MGAKFQVVDLSRPATPLAGGAGVGEVDLDHLRGQLAEIRDALTPVLDDQAEARMKLREIEVDLTVSFEGNIWFIAKGKGEASIKLQFSKS